MPEQRKDPLMDFRFLVEIKGLIVAGFSEVSGLQQEIEIEDYIEGGNDFVHKLPKGIKHNNLILKRGMTNSDTLWNWYQKTADAILYKKPIPLMDIYVVILNENREESWRFFFKDAYPIKWTGPELKGMGNDIAIETLEIVHKGFRKA